MLCAYTTKYIYLSKLPVVGAKHWRKGLKASDAIELTKKLPHYTEINRRQIHHKISRIRSKYSQFGIEIGKQNHTRKLPLEEVMVILWLEE